MENSFEQIYLKGTAKYIKVNSSVNKYQDKETGYSLNLYLTPETEAKVRKLADKLLTVAQTQGWKNSSGTEVKTKDWLPKDFLIDKLIKEDNEGNKFIACKAPHLKKNKNGATERVYLPIFDKKGQLPAKEAQEMVLYNGSVVNVQLVVYAFFQSSLVQGVTTKMKALQIIERATSTNSIGSGFEMEKSDEKSADTNACEIEEEVPI